MGIGVLYNEPIFTDLILTLAFAFISGTLWGWVCRALKI